MKVSQLLGQTLRESPSEGESRSYEMLMRGGFIRQLSSGIYCYLPLALRCINKIKAILRDEMNRIGGQELSLPALNPGDLWRKSKRWDAIGEELFRFKDRKERDMVLAMTHEEVVAFIASLDINSYKQLPLLVYQIQTKFRDEPRARGGLIRSREFDMKDAYSLDVDEEGLQQQYWANYVAYHRIFARCGLPAVVVQSDPGMMGGRIAHEFMYLTDIGEDTLALELSSGYAANREVATFIKEVAFQGNPLPMKRVATPAVKTIEELSAFLKIDPGQTCKAVFYEARYSDKNSKQASLVMALVRGDHEVNTIRVRNKINALELLPADEALIRQSGAVPGFASAVGLNPEKITVIADDLIMRSPNLVAGANEKDYHLLNVNYGRDFQAQFVDAIALAYDGAIEENSGKPIQLTSGVEIGNIFQLGTRYTQALESCYHDENQKRKPVVMGSYGIGVGRLLACIVEEYSSEKGMMLPITVAPFEVQLITIARHNETIKRTEKLYSDLQKAGVDVLWDDRNVRPGVMFADADLRGIPIRITVSDRSLKNGSVELKTRLEREYESIPLGSIVKHTINLLSELKSDLIKAAVRAEKLAKAKVEKK